MIKYAIRDGSKCMYCGTVIQDGEVHKEAVEFINGYPAPCRNIGKGIMHKYGEDIWLIANIRYASVSPHASNM